MSNADKLRATDQNDAVQVLMNQQLTFFGKVARKPEYSVLRQSIFCAGSLLPIPVTDKYLTRVCISRAEWATTDRAAREQSEMVVKCSTFTLISVGFFYFFSCFSSVICAPRRSVLEDVAGI